MVDMTQPPESPTLKMATPEVKPTHQLEMKPVPLTVPAVPTSTTVPTTAPTERTPLSRPTSPTRPANPVLGNSIPAPVSSTESSRPSQDLTAFQQKLIQEADRINQSNARAVEAVVQNNTAAARRIQTRVTYEADRIRKLMDKLSDEYTSKEEDFFRRFCCGCQEP